MIGWLIGTWAISLVIPLMDECTFFEWLGWAVFMALLLGFSFGLAAVVA